MDDSSVSNSKTDLAQYIPFAIATCMVLYSIIDTLTKQNIDPLTGNTVVYRVISEIWYSTYALIIILILILLKVKYWKHLFTILLITAALKLVQFSPTTSGLEFDLLQIEFTGLFLLVLQLTLNKEPIKELMSIIGISITEEPAETVVNESDIKLYFKRYQSKSQKELIEIADNKKYTAAARQAAKRLIN